MTIQVIATIWALGTVFGAFMLRRDAGTGDGVLHEDVGAFILFLILNLFLWWAVVPVCVLRWRAEYKESSDAHDP